MRVIGAGLGRTGTFSLKLALEQLLGGPCYHMAEVFERPRDVSVWTRAAKGEAVDWQALFDGYEAGVDWPLCGFAADLADVYPDALVLLSIRDFESWWKSASTTIFQMPAEVPPEWREMIDALFGNTFTRELGDKEACREAFDRHYRQVQGSASPDHGFSNGIPATAGHRSATRSASPFQSSRSRTAIPPRKFWPGARTARGRVGRSGVEASRCVKSSTFGSESVRSSRLLPIPRQRQQATQQKYEPRHRHREPGQLREVAAGHRRHRDAGGANGSRQRAVNGTISPPRVVERATSTITGILTRSGVHDEQTGLHVRVSHGLDDLREPKPSP